jgi:hypothetical protein
MATFLVRAFGFEPVFPQINAVSGRVPWCAKDGLMCYLSVTVPLRTRYEVREGFYALVGDGDLANSGTRLEMTLNGLNLAIEDLGLTEVGALSQRNFRAQTGLSPGVHTLVIRWWWNGTVEQTTTLIITVQT